MTVKMENLPRANVLAERLTKLRAVRRVMFQAIQFQLHSSRAEPYTTGQVDIDIDVETGRALVDQLVADTEQKLSVLGVEIPPDRDRR